MSSKAAESKRTPVYALLVLSGWHGSSATKVICVGSTPKRFRIQAITRTRLAGRGRWLEPGQRAFVPASAVRHGEWSTPATAEDLAVGQEVARG